MEEKQDFCATPTTGALILLITCCVGIGIGYLIGLTTLVGS